MRDRLPKSTRRKRGELWAGIYLRLFGVDSDENTDGRGDEADADGRRPSPEGERENE